MTVFNDALRVIFDDTNIAVAATYSPPGGGTATACRVIVRHEDQPIAFGNSRPIGEATFVDVLAADLSPVRGGTFTIDGVGYLVAGDPVRSDVDGAIWSCTVR